MSKYVFKRSTDAFYTDSKTVVSFTANELDEVLEEFTYFLKGCGFELDGKICVVTDKIETNNEPFNYDDDEIIKVFSGNYSDESFKTDHHVRQAWPWPDIADSDSISLVNSSPIMSTINLDSIQITTMNDNIPSSDKDDIISIR